VLFGLVVLVAYAVLAYQRGWRQTLPSVLAAAAGFIVVASVHLALGFNWLIGLHELRVRYFQGIASQRPYAYFVWANVGAWLVSCSPLLAVGIVRALRVLGRWKREPRWPSWSSDRVVALLGLSGVLAALLADLSGLSKAETERIWLSFGAVAWTTMALIRGRWGRWMLLAAAAWAIGVNHLLDTGW
jgi:hypothetical protein